MLNMRYVLSAILIGSFFIATIPINSFIYPHKSYTNTVHVKNSSSMILLVNDGSYFEWYVSALEAVGYKEGVDFDTIDSDLISNAEYLLQYDIVIWACGGYGYPDSSEQSILSSYLDSGGSLIIAGQDIGYSMGNNDFFNNYLHAYYVADDANADDVYGESGTFMEGMNVSLYGSESANNNNFPDVIQPLGDAFTIMRYSGDSYDGYPAAIAYHGNYDLVYFSFPVESVNGNSTRGQLLTSAINFFVHPIEILSPSQGSILCNKDIEIKFVIYDVGIDFSYAEVFINDSLVKNISPVVLNQTYVVSSSVTVGGQYSIRVDAYTADATKYTEKIAIYVDLEAPTLSINWHDNDVIGPLNNTLNINASDDLLIDSLKVYLNDTIEYEEKNIDSKSITDTISIDVEKSGRYNLHVVVSDYCDRKAEVSINVFIDVSPPLIIFDIQETPFKNRTVFYVKIRNITVDVKLNDTTRIKNVEIYVDDQLESNTTVDNYFFEHKFKYYINDTFCKIVIYAIDYLDNSIIKIYKV